MEQRISIEFDLKLKKCKVDKSIFEENTLDKLFDKLIKVDSSNNAELLEKKIWSIWSEHPNNEICWLVETNCAAYRL